MKKLSTFLFLTLSIYVFAIEPTDYYKSAEGKSDAVLRSAIQNVITTGHAVTTYGGLWTAYATTDINPATGKIWDMYSNCSFTLSVDQNKGTTGIECTNYNREHSVPNSWWGGIETVPQYSDVIHLVPTDSRVNQYRGNNPYGEVGLATYTSGNGSKLGPSDLTDYTGTVFEPIDEYKGDFARIYFYIATRYANECGSWTKGQGSAIFGTPTLGLSTYAINLFLKWSRQDPVSTKETSRNDAVYGVQHNRNPYVDYPELAEYIWGTHKGELWSLTSSVSEIKVKFRISPNPIKDEMTVLTEDQNLIYTIYNLSGQLINESQLKDSHSISAKNLNNGMYLLQLKSGNKKTIQKFIVQK